MEFFNWKGNDSKKTYQIAYQQIGNDKKVVFTFFMKMGKIVIDCNSASPDEPVVIVPYYNPQMGRMTEMGLGEQDLADDIQTIIDIIDAKDMGDMAFYNAFDRFTERHVHKYNRLVDSDLFCIVAEILLLMEGVAKSRNIVLSNNDKIDMTRTFVNRALNKFSPVYYVTRYRMSGLGMQPYLEKYK